MPVTFLGNKETELDCQALLKAEYCPR